MHRMHDDDNDDHYRSTWGRRLRRDRVDRDDHHDLDTVGLGDAADDDRTHDHDHVDHDNPAAWVARDPAWYYPDERAPVFTAEVAEAERTWRTAPDLPAGEASYCSVCGARQRMR